MATQERLDLARLYIEKISQDLRVVPLPSQPWFQSINILGEHIFDHIRAHRFLADLVSFLEGTHQIVFELLRRRELFAHRSKCVIRDGALYLCFRSSQLQQQPLKILHLVTAQPHLFERFWRKDTARSESEHFGIGLALTKTICGRLGIQIAASLEEESRVRFWLHFANNY
jgi:hypothetical protein